MAIEIVSFPIKNCDFPVRHVSLPEGIYPKLYIYSISAIMHPTIFYSFLLYYNH